MYMNDTIVFFLKKILEVQLFEHILGKRGFVH